MTVEVLAAHAVAKVTLMITIFIVLGVVVKEVMDIPLFKGRHLVYN